MFSTTVDRDLGLIRACGRLSPLAVELLTATVESLFTPACRHVTVDLGEVHAAEGAALAALDDLQQRIATTGGVLVFWRVPEAVTEAV